MCESTPRDHVNLCIQYTRHQLNVMSTHNVCCKTIFVWIKPKRYRTFQCHVLSSSVSLGFKIKTEPHLLKVPCQVKSNGLFIYNNYQKLPMVYHMTLDVSELYENSEFSLAIDLCKRLPSHVCLLHVISSTLQWAAKTTPASSQPPSWFHIFRLSRSQAPLHIFSLHNQRWQRCKPRYFFSLSSSAPLPFAMSLKQWIWWVMTMKMLRN